MKLAKQMGKIRAWISSGLATQHPVKLVRVAALGALLMAGTASHFALNSAEVVGSTLPNDSAEVNPYDEIDAATEDLLDELVDLHFGTIYADGPSRPLLSQAIVIERGQRLLPEDAWMFDAPFYEDFGAQGS